MNFELIHQATYPVFLAQARRLATRMIMLIARMIIRMKSTISPVNNFQSSDLFPSFSIVSFSVIPGRIYMIPWFVKILDGVFQRCTSIDVTWADGPMVVEKVGHLRIYVAKFVWRKS